MDERANSVRFLALACHPVPTVAVTAVSVLLAAGVGLATGDVVLLGLAVFTGQLSIGWSNDRIDAARDAATGRGDKPAATGRVGLELLGAAAAAALAATIVLSGLLGGRAGLALLTLVGAGWAYNVGLKATVFSGLAYVVGFGALPAAPYLARAGHPWPPWWVPVTGALLGLGAHVANVLPDLRDDVATGVRGMPHRLGARRATLVMAAAFAAASVVLGFGPHRPLPVAIVASSLGVAGAAAVGALAVRRPASAVAFRLSLALAVVDVVLVVTLAG